MVIYRSDTQTIPYKRLLNVALAHRPCQPLTHFATPGRKIEELGSVTNDVRMQYTAKVS